MGDQEDKKLARELKELKTQLAQNDEKQQALQQEAKLLREKIKKIDALQDRVTDLENANKRVAIDSGRIDSGVTKLVGEVEVIKEWTGKIANDVEAIKVKVGQQDTQSMQIVIGVVSDLKVQVEQLAAAHTRANNKRELADFSTGIHSLFSETLAKLKEPLFDKLFGELLNSIIDAWRARINSGEDIAPALDAVEGVLTLDVKSLANAQVRTTSFTRNGRLDEVTRMFNEYVSISRYLPQTAPKPIVSTQNTSSKNLEQGFVHVNGGNSSNHHHQSNQVSHTTTIVPKNQIYYDVDESEVQGLNNFITQSFPNAMKYRDNVSSPCVILTFIIVHDRLDMVKWSDICNDRMAKSDGKHYVILVCNKFGDASSLGVSNAKLASKQIFKAEFDILWDKTGTGGRPPQVFLPRSADTAVSAIKAFVRTL